MVGGAEGGKPQEKTETEQIISILNATAYFLSEIMESMKVVAAFCKERTITHDD